MGDHRIRESARRYGVADHDIRHALVFAIRVRDMDGYTMIIGPTTTGKLIEVAYNNFGDAFHAMSARNRFFRGRK